jgi:fluoride exporter
MPENPVCPGSDEDDPRRSAKIRPLEWDLLAAISVGGVLGAEARYGVDTLVPHRVGGFNWATVGVNASGCLLVGVLMAWLLSRARPPRLARPFLGVGILGGYTTYSTFAVDTVHLLHAHRPLVALGYVITTVVSALGAVWCAGTLARRIWAPA